MAGNLKKFINPRFLKTIDLGLMKQLLARHEEDITQFSLDLLDQDETAAREELHKLLAGSEDTYPEGLRADLHRIAELGSNRGLEITQEQAEREGIDLFPEMKAGDEDVPDKRHDPKHIAVRVFLEHPGLFDVAADRMAMCTVDRLHEYAGRERGVTIDLTEEKVEAFRAAVADLFRGAFLGDYCRVGDYVDGDEINLVVSHGSMVSTMPVVEGQQERVISVRQISHAVLRYSETTGMLRLARFRKAHQAEIAELFASIILERPGFFDDDNAQDLYTLRPVELAGPDFTFDAAYDPQIDKVLIIEAAADQMAPGKNGYPRVVRTLRSRDIRGNALQHFGSTPVSFRGAWRLGELVFRVLFKGVEGKRQPQVTVKLRPPSVVQFRRTQHEARVMTLIERHGLLHDRDDFELVDAAE
ncbi:MAG: hypothetical protein ACU0B9_07115 [Limimaricola soesokkakensis]|uniref:hypothetical protein n=1 Tax=Limimaricola soesokkakensis TaxID=1343159 RepID=UPI0040582227